MKSQDIFILLKLVCLEQKELISQGLIEFSSYNEEDWMGWEVDGDDKVDKVDKDEEEEGKIVKSKLHSWEVDGEAKEKEGELVKSKLHSFVKADSYSARGLSASLGVSKSEVNASIRRSMTVGIVKHDRIANHPKVNTKALLEFIVYGLKYVFPVKPAEIIRGIPTSFAAPILKGQLMTAGEFIYVWPDVRGKNMGQSITPLFKSVPFAVKQDRSLYEYLALLDAIRLGNAREVKMAENLLEKRLRKE